MTDEPPADEETDERSDGTANDRAIDDGDQTRDPPQPMTDDTDTTDNTEQTDRSGLDRLSTDDLRGLLDRIGLAALSLLAVVAGWGFYSQSGNAIRTWFDPAYQSVALAVFNLAVLLVALAGVTHQLRRIRAAEADGPER